MGEDSVLAVCPEPHGSRLAPSALGPRPLGPSSCRGFPVTPVAMQLLLEDVFISPSVLEGVCPVGGVLGGRTVRRGVVSMRACPCSSVLYVRRSGGCDSFSLPSARAVYDTGAGTASSCFLCLYSALGSHPRLCGLRHARVADSGRCPRPRRAVTRL